MTIKTHGRMFTDNTVGITQLALADGTDGQAIVTDGSGTLRFATVGAGGSVGSSVYIEDLRTGDGSTATFTLSTGAPYEESIMVFIDGVAQPTSAYTLPSSTSITFSPAPAASAAIRIVHLGIASSVADNAITGAKIAMGSDAAGDILYYNGTDYQRLGIGTAGQHLATNTGATAPEWVASTASGSIVQSRSVFTSTTSNFTSLFGVTGTLGLRKLTAFTISEGTEVLTLAITPTSTSNYLRIFSSIMCDVSVDNGMPMLCLYRDAITNCLQVGSSASYGNGGWHSADPAHVTLDHIMQAPSTSAQTYRIRAGQSAHFANGTMYINQNKNGAVWGGVGQSVMTIVEYVP